MPQKFQNKTYEQLIDLLNKKEVTSSFIKKKTEVSYFLKSFNITTGSHHIDSDVLYTLYSYWSKEPIDISEFKQELQIFDLIIKKGVAAININHSSISDALLSLINGKKKITSDVIINKHFDKFFSFYSIKPGNDKVAENDIHYLYCKWALYTNANRLNKKKFKNCLSINFKKTITKKSNYYDMCNTANTIIKQERMLDVLDANEKSKTK